MKTMKKINECMATVMFVIFTMVAVSACGGDDSKEDILDPADPTPTVKKFFLPCTSWGASKNDVKEYMNSKGKFTVSHDEDDDYISSTVYDATDGTLSVLYSFGKTDTGLNHLIVYYMELDRKTFDSLYESITKEYAISWAGDDGSGEAIRYIGTASIKGKYVSVLLTYASETHLAGLELMVIR